MSPSKNICCIPTTSPETTTLSISPLNSPHVTKADLFNTIKFLLVNFYDKHYKQDTNFKEPVKTIIVNQDSKFGKKFETQLQPLSHQIKYIQYKQGEQDKLFYTFTATYYYRFDNMSTNNKIRTKFEIAKTEFEAIINMKWINTNLKHISPLTWNYKLSIKINLLSIITKLQLISLNGHFSSKQKNIPMHHNSPNIYHAWPYKATPFFKFKNIGMQSFLPSSDIYQLKIAGRPSNISKYNITTYIHFSSH